MVLSVDQIITNFMYNFFPLINSKQDYHTIHDICTLLYGNTSTLTTMLGEGNRGHIGLVVQDTLYAKISHMIYDMPMDPGGKTAVPLQ